MDTIEIKKEKHHAQNPVVNLTEINLTAEEAEIVKLCLGREERLKSTKPVVHKDQPLTGKASYVWRLAAFYLSPNPQHSQHFPVSAQFDLPAYDAAGNWSARIARDHAIELDKLVDKMILKTPRVNHTDLSMWRRNKNAKNVKAA